MKTLIIGDLHGQVEIAEKALRQGLPVIFMGDYVDSFERSISDQIETLIMVLDAVKSGEAQALYGNHELSYLIEGMRCSGFKPVTEAHMMHMNLTPLQDYIFAEGFLLSHAGVTNKLLKAKNITLQDYLDVAEFTQIGRARGGWDTHGGLYWCDWNQEFSPIPNQPQIVGHTRGKGIRRKINSYCVDCLEDGDPQAITIEDGKVETHIWV